MHLIKINGLALWLDESAHASLAARSFVRGLEIHLKTDDESSEGWWNLTDDQQEMDYP